MAEADAAAQGSNAKPTGTLTLTSSVFFGQEFMIPILTDYLTQYPDVTVKALFFDRIANVVDEGIDVAIRIGHLPDSNHSAVRVGTVRRIVVGSRTTSRNMAFRWNLPISPATAQSSAPVPGPRSNGDSGGIRRSPCRLRRGCRAAPMKP